MRAADHSAPGEIGADYIVVTDHEVVRFVLGGEPSRPTRYIDVMIRSDRTLDLNGDHALGVEPVSSNAIRVGVQT